MLQEDKTINQPFSQDENGQGIGESVQGIGENGQGIGENGRRTRHILISIGLFLVVAGLVYTLVTKPWERLRPQDLDTIDLTVMNSNMVYAYVNDMVNNNPEDYLGKTVKAQGAYVRSYFQLTDKHYHYVLISDATACCEQGLEFLYEGEYPIEDEVIVIEGTFARYDELGQTYYYIDVITLSVLQGGE